MLIGSWNRPDSPLDKRLHTEGPPFNDVELEVRDDDGGLARLHARLLAALEAVSGWQPERRRLRPHITVARMRGGRRAGVAPELTAPTPALTFAADSLALYRSFLERAGARYEALARCELEEEA